MNYAQFLGSALLKSTLAAILILFCLAIQAQDLNFYMEIPEELVEYNEEIKRIKYPGENGPDIVYGDDDASVTIGFTIDTTVFRSEEIPEMIVSLRQALEQSGGAEWVSDSLENIGGISFGVMRFWSPSPDGRIYNTLCAGSYEDQMIMITFNFLEEDYEEWYEELELARQSISFESEE